ncbi:unnamed protein product [Protopolystoma xenopodis]|uniref:Carboxylesterase type B domain-containing protein n=1 Tax=Protopolystoma xenopodis TaxID=117903 RepID=A0A448WP40_9PLAT|nr:unnamed protein product [Protopolystoma xenopodis]
MLDDDEVYELKFIKKKSYNDFFPVEKPSVDVNRRFAFLSRPLDLVLFLGVLTLAISFVIRCLLLMSVSDKVIVSSQVLGFCAVYEGHLNANKTVLRFYGIPYAIAPLRRPNESGELLLARLQEDLGLMTPGVEQPEYFQFKHSLRWQKPIPVNSFETCLLSHQDRCQFADGGWACDMRVPRGAKNCYQSVLSSGMAPPDEADIDGSSEGCLNVDIAAPPYMDQLLPVVILATGEQFLTSPLAPPDFSQLAFAPSDFAVLATQAIWVRVHFRLGLAGFFFNLKRNYEAARVNMTTSERRESERRLHHVNFALHDLRAAVEWVHANAVRFGGDPSRITLLAHGSAATAGLALLKWLSTEAATAMDTAGKSLDRSRKSLFRSVWLASGSVRWGASNLKPVGVGKTAGGNADLTTAEKRDSNDTVTSSPAASILSAGVNRSEQAYNAQLRHNSTNGGSGGSKDSRYNNGEKVIQFNTTGAESGQEKPTDSEGLGKLKGEETDQEPSELDFEKVINSRTGGLLDSLLKTSEWQQRRHLCWADGWPATSEKCPAEKIAVYLKRLEL